MVTALARSLDKPLPWEVGLFFANPELTLKLYTVVIGICAFSDRTVASFVTNIGSKPISLLGLEKRNGTRSTPAKRYLGISTLNPVVVTVLVATSI